jgi:hypothetical protein
MSVESAIWLAIAQPSSSVKCLKAPAEIRTDRFKTLNGRSYRPETHQIIYCCALCKAVLGLIDR